jgi:ketosteroid isomerase-like protein
MKAFMKMVLVLILFGAVSVDTALAQPPKPASQGPSVADTIKQLDQSWADAMIVVDIPTLNRIVADDWISGYPGKASTKAKFLDDVKSGKHKLETCEFGPRDVQVVGDVAVLQGSVTETRLVDGQRSTFRVNYMDVWVKRGDQWMVFRSHATKT